MERKFVGSLVYVIEDQLQIQAIKVSEESNLFVARDSTHTSELLNRIVRGDSL